MDLQTFIQSGLLESYVLGQCTPEERALVERMAREHPSVQTELAAIESALEQYAMGHAVSPPEGMKERILKQIDTPYQAPADRTTPPDASGAVRRLLPYLAGILAVTALALTFTLFSLLAENTALRRDVATLQKDLEDCSRKSSLNQDIVDQLFIRDAKPAVLAAKGSSTPALVVYHNKERHETILEMSAMVHPEKDKYWQAWAIVDNVPVSLGMVKIKQMGERQVLPFLDHAAAFAISEEDKPGGNSAPTKVLMVANAL
jgi:anti-sigma-K factor RskA